MRIIGEIMEIKIPLYNDVWMDNAVENLYRLIADSEEGVDITLDKTELTIHTNDKDELRNILSPIIQNNRNNLIIKHKDKKQGNKGNKKILCSFRKVKN